MSCRIPEALIAEENGRLASTQAEDYAALGRRLKRAAVVGNDKAAALAPGERTA